MSARALARKIGVSAQTLDGWKRSRPEADNLHRLARAIDVDYAILLAAVDADGDYTTDDDFEAVLKDRKRITPEMRERLRRHISRPSTDDLDKSDTGPAQR